MVQMTGTVSGGGAADGGVISGNGGTAIVWRASGSIWSRMSWFGSGRGIGARDQGFCRFNTKAKTDHGSKVVFQVIDLVVLIIVIFVVRWSGLGERRSIGVGV